MNLLGPPLEVIISAGTSVFGRATCFLLTCSFGCALGFVFGHWGEWNQGWYFSALAYSLLIFPTAMTSTFVHWGFVIYPLCILMAFVFIRFELAFKWLVVPLALIAWDSAALRMILD
jgi:hypothetical protein